MVEKLPRSAARIGKRSHCPHLGDRRDLYRPLAHPTPAPVFLPGVRVADAVEMPVVLFPLLESGKPGETRKLTSQFGTDTQKRETRWESE